MLVIIACLIVQTQQHQKDLLAYVENNKGTSIEQEQYIEWMEKAGSIYIHGEYLVWDLPEGEKE